MNLYDTKTKEQWQSLLNHINQETKMVAALTDTENAILQTSGERNSLCAKIRSLPESASYICTKTQAAMAGESRVDRKPVVEICEAGLAKFVVPLFDGEDWLGTVTACGSCYSQDEVDDFVISRNTPLKEEEVKSLIKEIAVVSEESLSTLANQLFCELN